MAERVIAKLRRKVPKFALMVAREEAARSEVPPDIVNERYAVLRQLGHSEPEARRLIDAALGKEEVRRRAESAPGDLRAPQDVGYASAQRSETTVPRSVVRLPARRMSQPSRNRTQLVFGHS